MKGGTGTGRVERDPDTHRVNNQIRFPQLRVIGPDGEQLGIMSPEEARDVAAEHGLDLVEVAPQARPPVCRIMDYGKFRYQQSKRQSSSKATRVEVKTITMRPKTDQHDLETKLRQARKFLEAGDRVKFVMRLRGREHAHIGMWVEKMGEILVHLQDLSTVSQSPKLEGRTITASIEPLASKETKDAKDKKEDKRDDAAARPRT